MVVHLDGKVTGDYVLETPAAGARLSVSAGTGDAGCRHLPGGLSAAGQPDSNSAGSRDHERHDVTRAGRQRVCGIVTNERPNVVRTEYDALRAILHNSAIHGPATQNRQAVPDFRAHLLCRIHGSQPSTHARRKAPPPIRRDRLGRPDIILDVRSETST